MIFDWHKKEALLSKVLYISMSLLTLTTVLWDVVDPRHSPLPYFFRNVVKNLPWKGKNVASWKPIRAALPNTEMSQSSRHQPERLINMQNVQGAIITEGEIDKHMLHSQVC